MKAENFSKDLNRSMLQLQKLSENQISNWYRQFPKLATECLQKLNTEPFNDPKIIANLMLQQRWPAQHFTSGHFADLAFTLFRSAHFFLDLYIWHHQDTNIHDHHFSGAFKVVHGESYHIAYDFTDIEKIYPWLEKGKLQVLDKGTLQAGDVKSIGFSKDFIHQNIHVSNPCITLCLRTNDHPKKMLSSYFNKGMRLQLSRMTLKEQKLLDVLVHLSTQNDHSAAVLIVKKISDQTLYNYLNGQFTFYNRASANFRSIIVNELMRRDASTCQWFEKNMKAQAQLNRQLISMLKT